MYYCYIIVGLLLYNSSDIVLFIVFWFFQSISSSRRCRRRRRSSALRARLQSTVAQNLKRIRMYSGPKILSRASDLPLSAIACRRFSTTRDAHYGKNTHSQQRVPKPLFITFLQSGWPKMMPKSSNILPKGPQRSPTWPQRVPKGIQGGPRTTKVTPKGSQRD